MPSTCSAPPSARLRLFAVLLLLPTALLGLSGGLLSPARAADPAPASDPDHVAVGRVVGPDGVRIAGATVELSYFRPAAAGLLLPYSTAQTDADGRYAVALPGPVSQGPFGPLGPATVTLRFDADRYQARYLGGEPTVVTPTAQNSRVVPASGGLTLPDQVLPRSVRLRGVVLDQDGARVAGATVTVRDAFASPLSPPNVQRTTTRRSGRFALLVDDGVRALTVDAPGCTSTSVPSILVASPARLARFVVRLTCAGTTTPAP